MFVPREVIRDNPQEFITRYSINDYTVKLNRCYNSGLILQKIDNHAPVPGKPISANQGLNIANRWINFIPLLDSVPESTINLNLGIN